METAYIIFMNDGPMYVIINDEEKAKAKMEELAEAYWSTIASWGSYKDYKEYRDRCYWHIHEVKADVFLEI